MNKFLFNILILILFFDYYEAQYSCKSPTGEAVDWFVVYKLPRMQHRNRLIAQGRAYLYADENSNGWTLPDHGIVNTQSAIGHTVEQRFNPDEQQFYLTYNDRCPDLNPNFERGHMKGMVLFDQIYGFWLIHSVPNFPMLETGRYEYPRTGFKNGQTFLCISLSTFIFQTYIAPLLHFSEANRCSRTYVIPQWIQQNAFVIAIVQREPSHFHPANEEQSFRRMPFPSSNGQGFEAFFKYNGLENRDLYTHVGTQLGISEFMVQSYLLENDHNNNPPLMFGCPNCANHWQCPFKVRNITRICLQNIRIEYDTFLPGGPDHSKWAVSNYGGPPWVCIGDLNRQQSQLNRGGGAVCFQNVIIANLFRQAVCRDGVQEWCSRH